MSLQTDHNKLVEPYYRPQNIVGFQKALWDYSQEESQHNTMCYWNGGILLLLPAFAKWTCLENVYWGWTLIHHGWCPLTALRLGLEEAYLSLCIIYSNIIAVAKKQNWVNKYMTSANIYYETSISLARLGLFLHYRSQLTRNIILGLC